MTRVLLLSRYGRLGASSRIRHHDLVPALEAKGFRFDTVPLLSDAYLRRFYAGQRTAYAEIANGYLARAGAALRARGHDLIWIEKEAFPCFPGRWRAPFSASAARRWSSTSTISGPAATWKAPTPPCAGSPRQVRERPWLERTSSPSRTNGSRPCSGRSRRPRGSRSSRTASTSSATARQDRP